MKLAYIARAVAAGVISVAATTAQAEVLNITGHVNDQEVQSDGTLRFIGQADMRVGGANSTTGADGAAFFIFDLPDLASNETLISASLSLGLVSQANTPSGHGDLYGIGYRATPNVTFADYFQGVYGTDSNATALQDDMFVIGLTGGVTHSTSVAGSANLLNFLNGLYDAGATGSDYAVLRVNIDVANETNSRYWSLASANNSNAALRPVLTVETAVVPEPSATVALAGGLVLLVALRRRRSR